MTTAERIPPSLEVLRHEANVTLRDAVERLRDYDRRLDLLLAELRVLPARLREILDAQR